MRWGAAVVVAAVVGVGVVADAVAHTDAAAWWRPADLPARDALERALLAVPDPDRLRAWHDALGAGPHMAGTDGDKRVISFLVDSFEAMGLEVERHDIWVYLPVPVSGAVTIEHPDVPAGEAELAVTERVLAVDPQTALDDLPFGFNAYSGSGVATGPVVYANYGRREDFATLRRLGVDLRGRIVIARYGGNYRGYKAKFAEEAGAAGVLIYTDPKDSGYARGLPYPDGGWADDTSIQRGSIKTLPYAGDALTPFVPATRDAERLDPDAVALPTIPVQPIGWGAAQKVMERMNGRPLPATLIGDWQGGLPFAYRLEGGADLRVRVAVEQQRRVTRTANVVARLRGATRPREVVVVGCHHDAWGIGASDPLAGLITVLEAARSFAAAAEAGHRPARTIAFAAWGAEEHGIIGSTEWCETHRAALTAGAVAYVNLDMAAMGPNLRSSADPLLKRVVAGAAGAVPSALDAGRTALDAWRGDAAAPRFGNLGGGSDHVGFYCHLGVPSCSLGAGGSRGTSYHSNYDTLRWYRQVVGDDYTSALLVTRVAAVAAARLAGATLVPYDPARVTRDTVAHLDTLTALAEATDFGDAAGRAAGGAADVEADGAQADAALAAIGHVRAECSMLAERLEATTASLLAALAAGRLDADAIGAANETLLSLGRCWIDEAGLPDRPWFRNLYAATDPHSGYAAWMLPGLRAAIDTGDATAVAAEADRVLVVLDRLETARKTLARVAGAG